MCPRVRSVALISELKDAVRASGKSYWGLSRETGGVVIAPELSRWMRGLCCLGEKKLDALAAVLGVRLAPRAVRVARAKSALVQAASRVPAERNAVLAAELLGQS